MNLVDEKQRALAHGALAAGFLEDFLEFGDAGENGGYLGEDEIGLAREQARDGRLARAGWPPKDQRTERAHRDQSRQRAIGADEVVLSAHILQRGRAEPIGERTRRRRRQARGLE